MVTFVFGVEDMARLRFAISPMWELTASLRALIDPSAAGLHLPWIESLKGQLGGIDLLPAMRLVPLGGYIPDFIAPPPNGPLEELPDQLDAVRYTQPKEVKREIGIAYRDKPLPAELEPMLAHPKREVARLADTFDAYWQRALEPHWPRIRALLQADIEYRAKQLTQGGPAAVFADLHGTVHWRGDRLEVDQKHEEVLELAGRGLLLLPTVFVWGRPMVITDDPWWPTLVYPARGVGTLWESGPTTPDALAALLGKTRAALLTALDAPRSTTEIARRLGVSAGGASQHLSVLRDGGLVVGRRDGRSVLYVRTQLADALVRGDA
jgi:hypothetical protein